MSLIPACLWTLPSLISTSPASQARRRASSRPGPAAVPHPTSPPRLIPPTRHPAPPQCHIPVGPTAASHPGSALHWHPGPGPPPHLIQTVIPSLHCASSGPASRPPPRLVPTQRFTGTQARLAPAPASPACRPDPEPLGLNTILPDPRAFGREKGFTSRRLASLQPSLPLHLILPCRRASS